MKINIPPEKLREIKEKSDTLIKIIIFVMILLLLMIFLINNFEFIKEKIVIIF